jgi:tetratricopeptide (TPR) repeat protein
MNEIRAAHSKVLTGAQRKLLKAALVSAFNFDTLRELMSDSLNEELENIVDKGPFNQVVHDLIVWADHNGRLNELVCAALEERPRNLRVKAIATELLVVSTPDLVAVSNISVRVPNHFMGRDDSLIAIGTALKRKKGHGAVAALHGLPGMGKTALAHQNDYRATWWIRAQTELTMRADLVQLGIRLKWFTVVEEESALAAVMERLRHEGEGVLLIYDNAPDVTALKRYLPRGGAAHALVTSNAHAWRGVASPIEIRQWRKEIGADYFVARTGREKERADAETLSEALGGLPLAHEQAAAYCERLDISLSAYRKRFEAAPVKFLDDTSHAPIEYNDGRTVAKTFSLAIDEAAKLNPAAEPLIVYAALLAPAPIPLYLFAAARKAWDEPLASALDDDGLDAAVAALRMFALVEREAVAHEREPSATTDCLRLHRLVQQIAAARLPGADAQILRRMWTEVLSKHYPDDGYDNPASWPRCAFLLPHLLTCCGTDYDDAAGNEIRGHLLNKAGAYLQARAAYSTARLLFERALDVHEKALDPEHPSTAISLGNLATLLQEEGDLNGARPLYERALAIEEKALGPEHPSAATTLNNLARLLSAQGDLKAARPLYERALAINEKELGPEHPATATSLNNLALLLQEQGNLAAARPLHERALTIKERVLDAEHPSMATSLNNLASLLRDQGDLAAARPLYERALAIKEKVLGPEHPGTATSLNNLALLLQYLGDRDAARPLYQRALAIEEKVLGPEHPSIATSLSNLASLLRDEGDRAAARPLYERALAICEKALGPDHPITVTIRARLETLSRQPGDCSAAADPSAITCPSEKDTGN